MKHNILPESWCVANCSGVVNYMHEKYKFGLDFLNGESGYYGVEGKNKFIKNKPFGQLLTEEQFLYCIGEPERGEVIQASVTERGLIGAIEMTLLMLTDDGAWCLVNNTSTNAVFFNHYRRKPLIFVDKWAKEKQAFAEGKTIQSRKIYSLNRWEDNISPSWSEEWQYRIKPEPKYAPFTRKDWDLFKMKDVIFDPSKINTTSIGVVTGCDSDGVIVSHEYFSYEYMFKNALFADGTPFGKLIEE